MKVPSFNSPEILRKAFTLVEMLVVIAIIAVLASLVFVGVRAARDSAYRAASTSNLRQLGVGFAMFRADNHGYLPISRDPGSKGGGFWPQKLYP